MRMSLTKDRQGYLGDLNELTVPQLKELLERQEKILSKKKFLNCLPDKGVKTQAFADKLKKMIFERSDKESRSNSGFHSKEAMQRLQDSQEEMDNIDSSTEVRDDLTIRALVTRDETNVVFDSEESNSDAVSFETEGDDHRELTSQMQGLAVGSEHREMSSPQENSYERVIKKAEANPSTKNSKFLPHKSKKEKNPGLYVPPKIKHKPDSVKEESAVCPPEYSHESSKLISIEESVQLIEQQKKRTEQLASERAAQRLADQLFTKMDRYQPSDVDMRYRQRKLEDSDKEQDSDDFASDDDDLVGQL